MAYDDRLPITYSYTKIDFGAGDSNVSFKGPKGLQGYIREVIVSDEAETFTNVTTEARIDIGTGADADAYASIGLGVLADGDAISVTQESPSDLIERDLPADTQIEVAFVAPTGGTPAGIADVFIIVEWY